MTKFQTQFVQSLDKTESKAMKYSIIHFYPGYEFSIPGVYVQGFSEDSGRPLHFIDIPDDQFAAKMRELAEKYDIMLRGWNDNLIIWVDTKGRSFRQR